MPRLPTLTRVQVVEALSGEFGQPIVVLPWWREFLAALDDPATLLLILWLMRQAGKSQCLLHGAVSELLTKAYAFVLYVAASGDQAQAVFETQAASAANGVGHAAWRAERGRVHTARCACLRWGRN